MKEIPFIKMNTLGNDFVIIDTRHNNISLLEQNVLSITNRKFGIGCDQLILIQNSIKADCKIKIFNIDGSQSDTCVNGTKCVATIISKELNKKIISIETKSGIRECYIENNLLVTTNMGKPNTNWQDIPLLYECDTENLPISYGSFKNPIALNLGNPHIIFFLQDIDNLDISVACKYFMNHEIFKERTNIEIVEILDDKNIKVRIWERGVGETYSCGSGACAAIAASIMKKKITNSNNINIHVKYGKYQASVNEINGHIKITALTTHSYEGIYYLK